MAEWPCPPKKLVSSRILPAILQKYLTMCGIIGYWDKDGDAEALLGSTLLNMLEALACRGPDSAGVALFGVAAPHKVRGTDQARGERRHPRSRRANDGSGRILRRMRLEADRCLSPAGDPGDGRLAAMIARSCGKSNIHHLEPEDMAALSLEASAICGIPLAGTRKVMRL